MQLDGNFTKQKAYGSTQRVGDADFYALKGSGRQRDIVNLAKVARDDLTATCASVRDGPE